MICLTSSISFCIFQLPKELSTYLSILRHSKSTDATYICMQCKAISLHTLLCPLHLTSCW